MDRPPIAITPSRAVRWLVAATAVLSALAGGLTFLLPDLLTGPAVTNGNARGTGLIVAVVAVPTLLVVRIGLVARPLAGAGRRPRRARLPPVQRLRVPVRDSVQPAVPALGDDALGDAPDDGVHAPGDRPARGGGTS